jgi:hypothetical protein
MPFYTSIYSDLSWILVSKQMNAKTAADLYDLIGDFMYAPISNKDNT